MSNFLSSLFGYSDKPAQGTKVSYIPPELKPYVDEVLTDTQALYEQRMGEGYTPYTGQTIAGFTPEQLQSQAGLKGLVGSQRPYQDEALGIMRGGDEQFTADTAKKYMSPYQRAVIDEEKEQAQRQYERTKVPQFEAEAVRAGGMSGLGSRAGVEAAERASGQQRLLAGIETKGLQKAYEAAQDQFKRQKERERLKATDISQTGQNIFSAGLAEQGLLQGIGEEKQAMTKAGLDEAYMKWRQQQQFPEEQLSRYMSSIYGNPVLSQPTYTTTERPGQASMGKSLLGLGLAGYRAGGGFTPGGFSAGNLLGGGKSKVGGAGGGQVGGLSTLYRQTGSQVGMPRYSITGDEIFTEEDAPDFIEEGSGDPTSRQEAFIRLAENIGKTEEAPAPKPASEPTTDEPRRKTVAELVAEIRGQPQDAVMAGISAFLKPFGTPADMPGAMAEADRAAEVLAAKQELSIAKEETEATAKARIAQKKYLKKLREVKYADVRSSFKSAMSEQWGDIIVDDEGEIISIDKAYTGSNKQRFKTAIGKIRLEGMRKKAQGVPLEIIGRYYIDKLAGLKKNPLYQKKK